MATSRYGLTIQTATYKNLLAAFPDVPFSNLVAAMMDYAILHGFSCDTGRKQTDLFPALCINQMQRKFAIHALRYVCRAWEETADVKERNYLIKLRDALLDDKIRVEVDTYTELVSIAHATGWDNSSQDDAPVPKEGPPRRGTRDRKQPKTAAAKLEDMVALPVILEDDINEEVEEFGL